MHHTGPQLNLLCQGARVFSTAVGDSDSAGSASRRQDPPPFGWVLQVRHPVNQWAADSP
jgi:hypothetical protein